MSRIHKILLPSQANKIARALLRDRLGLIIFLGALVLFTTTWRLDILISDTDTVANTMVAVADGHLHVGRFPYGLTGGPETPGMHRLGEQYYGRNYGHVFLSLPFLWLFTAVTSVLDLSVAIPLGWSLLVAAFVGTVAPSTGHRRVVTAVGIVLAAAALAANLFFVTPFEEPRLALAALQASTMVAAAATGVVLYRLATEMHGRQVGAFAGTAVVVATPVWFWSTLPKRHALTALLPLASVYLLYRSRSAVSVGIATRFRALAYVPVGLTAWIHAPEGLLLLVALAPVDVATARWNDPRSLAVVGGVFALSLVPMFATNTVIAGNPLEPPRALPAVERGSTAVGQAEEGARAGSSAGIGDTLFDRSTRFVSYMGGSVGAAADPVRLFRVFVRSGLALGLHPLGTRSVNLSVLESMPLAGALFGVLGVAYRRGSAAGWRRVGGKICSVQRDPKRAADLLAVAYGVLLGVMYMPRLPIHVMFTVRYLHPLYPLAAYLLVRLPYIRKSIGEQWRLFGAVYAGAVVLGGGVLTAALGALAGDLSSTVQLHARVGLATAAVGLYWSLAAALTDEYARAGAVALALAGATTTLYAFLSAMAYFTFTSPYVLPVSRLLAEALTLW